MADKAAFWNRIARKYAAQPISDMRSYEATLDHVRSRLEKQHTVVELGCGTGTTALNLAASVKAVTATDVSPAMLAIAREKAASQRVDNIVFEQASLPSPAIAGAPFDVALAFNLLHLCPDLPAALADIRSLIRPGGLFISKTPCLGESSRFLMLAIAAMRLVGRAPPHLVRFTMAELEKAIGDAGFAIVETADYPSGGNAHFIVARRLD